MGGKANQIPTRTSAAPLTKPVPMATLTSPSSTSMAGDNMSLQRAARTGSSALGPAPSLSTLLEKANEAAVCRAPTPAPGVAVETGEAVDAPPPIVVKFDPAAPWKVLVDNAVSMIDLSVELYGVDLSPFFAIDDGFMSLAKATGQVRVGLLTDLLKPRYAQQFHAQMEHELDADVAYVEGKLMQTWVDDDDESAVLGRVRWWSQATEARDMNGVLYFDRFLARLESEQYYTDYGVTEGSRSSFLSLLHEEIEDDAGALVDLIANHSERFGAYRPTTLFPSVSTATDSSHLLVKRVTDQLLDRMVGFTSASDEQGIAGMVTALPGPLQARVLQDLMTRTSERRLKIFSRTGEQDGEGMLHFLFEDLEDEDKRRLGDSLRDKGVLTADAVEALIEGRTWAGRNLPWSTRHGKNAAMFWANEFNQSDNKLYSGVSATLGGFASLWTPETAGTTIVVLATANPSGVVGNTLSRAPLVVQKTLLVAGTGLGAYQATTSTMAAISGKDSAGNVLSGGERVGRAIEAVSALLMLGAGFHAATKLSPRVPTVAPRTALAPVAEAPLSGVNARAAGDKQRVAWRIVSETAEGEIRAVGLHHESGDLAVVSINKHTGDGSVFSPGFGRINIVGGKPVMPRPALGAGADAAGAGIPIEPGVSLLPARARLPPMQPGAPGGTGQAGLATQPAQPALPGTVAPVKPLVRGPNAAPLALASPPAQHRLEAPKYEDIGPDLQQHLNTLFGDDAVAGLTWSVTSEGTVISLPPAGLRSMPMHAPDGVVPPGELFAGQPTQPVLVGPLREGFSPFDIFPPPNAPTTSNLARVRRARGSGTSRGKPGVDFVGEQHRGPTEQALALPERVTKSGLAGIGVRETDVLAKITGGRLNLEVKNYLRFINGPAATVNQVSPSAQLRGEIWRDAMIPFYYPDQQSVWIFLGAPPSPALIAELAQAGIPWMVYSDALPYLGGILP